MNPALHVKSGHGSTRRRFLQTSLAGAAGLLALRSMPACAAGEKADAETPRWGLCQGLVMAGKVKEAGFDFIEGGVGSLLVPASPDAEFEAILAQIRKSPLPVRSCNGFIPAELRLTGPATKTEQAVEYARTALQRAGRAGISFIVLGSGKARAIPEGFDPKKAREQFVTFCRRIGAIATANRVTIVLEPLNKKETNFFNTVAEGVELVNEISEPSVQLLADLYHMLQENESPDSIRKAGTRLRHCHLAEKARRTPPGVENTDFGPFFRALKDIHYAGGISIEAGPWAKDPFPEMQRARAALTDQWASA
jgi:sugar phosphate isomerase/epimerase